MPRYGIKTLYYIAENYEDFEASLGWNTNIWNSENWSSIIDTKADFDRALGQLTPEEKKLVMNVNTEKIAERHQLLVKMLHYLINPPQYIPRPRLT